MGVFLLHTFFLGGGCVSTEHGCCPDNFTPAQGPGNAGCLCHTYEYGCCPDGKAIARGPGQVTFLGGPLINLFSNPPYPGSTCKT